MDVRYDFECQSGHQFTLWSDDARMCPTCGNEFLKRVFLTPPAATTGKANQIEKLVQRELSARGISNIQSRGEGEHAKLTYASTPESLASEMVTKEFPQLPQINGIQKVMSNVTARWAGVGAQGVIRSGLPRNQMAQDFLKSPTSYGRPEVVRIRDPENLQVKK